MQSMRDAIEAELPRLEQRRNRNIEDERRVAAEKREIAETADMMSDMASVLGLTESAQQYAKMGRRAATATARERSREVAPVPAPQPGQRRRGRPPKVATTEATAPTPAPAATPQPAPAAAAPAPSRSRGGDPNSPMSEERLFGWIAAKHGITPKELIVLVRELIPDKDRAGRTNEGTLMPRLNAMEKAGRVRVETLPDGERGRPQKHYYALAPAAQAA
jgi:hypothetical protein